MIEKAKDAADLFAEKGEGAKGSLERLKQEAQDALDTELAEAPEGSKRERYRHAKEGLFPLISRLGDAGERAAALNDVAAALELGKRDLRTSFSKFEAEAWEVPGEEEEAENLAPEPGSERHERAMRLLELPDVLEMLAENMERLGNVGDTKNKKLAFVCAVSAKAGRPVQPSTHAQSSSGKNFLWDKTIEFLPPEMVIRRSAISDKALFRTEADLRGAVLYLQEVVGSEGADFAIRVLQSAQYLEYEATEKMPDGTFGTVVHRKEGPVVVVQTTTKNHLFYENETRVVSLYVDESEEQTQRITDNYKRVAAGKGAMDLEERERIVQAWRDAVRLLEPGEVIVPYAERVEIPTSSVRARRDVVKLFDVVRIVAWLHQHRRERTSAAASSPPRTTLRRPSSSSGTPSGAPGRR